MYSSPAIIKPERVVESVSQTGLVGYFEVELIHKPTGLLKQKLRFKNLITDAGLNAIGNGTFGTYNETFGLDIIGSQAYVGVGSDSTTPSVTDTQLYAQVGSRTQSRGSPTIAMQWGNDTNYDYTWRKTTKVFFPGEATGNLTEVGIFRESSGGVMFARQLFRDSFGNPTTIVKTADDELRITYEFRLYTMKTESVTTSTIKSTSTTCTTRGYDIDAASRWVANTNDEVNGLINAIGGWGSNTGTAYQGLFSSNVMPNITASQTGTQTNASSVGWSGYTTNTYYRDVTIIWNPGLGNLTVGSIIWGGTYVVAGGGASANTSAPFITTFSPAFTKTDLERLTFVGRSSFGRI
jgi:hypothetical protein